MNQYIKIFITIFCYISGVMGIVTAVLSAKQEPAQTTTTLIAGVVGAVFLFVGLLLSRRPRH
jgi:uncharacterized membrane protein HdeD (DUF308 family)